jgi:inner membrane protein
MQWWHWLIVGFSLCLCELLIPIFVLIWLGISALILGIVVLLIPVPLTVQLLGWAILSTASVFLWLRVFRNRYQRTQHLEIESAIGEVGLLVRGVLPFQVGEVLFQRPVLGSDRWDCVSATGLEAGCRVRVVKIDGSTAVIEAA